MGFFKKVASALKKTRELFARKIDAIFSHGELDDDFYDEMEELLIGCDMGVKTALEVTEQLRLHARKNKLRSAEEVRNALRDILTSEMQDAPKIEMTYPLVLTIIGVNGVGKTTTIGKLAKYFSEKGKSVTLVAADTFRAAASEQLSLWAQRSKTRIIKHAEGADAAAVVYDGIASAKAKGTDVLIVDTAGRLHTKTNLMEELKKIGKVTAREYPEAQRLNLIVLDATTGQNAISQITAFDQSVPIDGIILTKLDGTAKGGVVVAIEKDLAKPVLFIGTGEGIDDIEEFDAESFVGEMF